MNIDDLIALAISIGLSIYLIIALLFPERL